MSNTYNTNFQNAHLSYKGRSIVVDYSGMLTAEKPDDGCVWCEMFPYRDDVFRWQVRLDKHCSKADLEEIINEADALLNREWQNEKFLFSVYEPIKLDVKHVYEVVAESEEQAIEKMKGVINSKRLGCEEDGAVDLEYLYDYEESDNSKPIELTDADDVVIYRTTINEQND